MLEFKEYRVLAIKGSDIVELEGGYICQEDAELSINNWKELYPEYEIKVEEY